MITVEKHKNAGDYFRVSLEGCNHDMKLDEMKELANDLWSLGFNIEPQQLCPGGPHWRYCPACGKELK